MSSQPIGQRSARDQPPLPPRPQDQYTPKPYNPQNYPQQQTYPQQFPTQDPQNPQNLGQPQFAPPPTRPLSQGKPHGSTLPPAADSSATSSGKPSMRERLYQLSIKVGAPVNRLTNRLGSEAFWPSSLDLESDKAARILTSFCKDGFYTDAPAQAAPAQDTAAPGPKSGSRKSLVKIPPEAIRDAAGLAIFTTFRTGVHISGAGGSGIVVARLPDGGWSPPSGFLVHTLGAGLLVGLDIYDCVCVLRTPAAVAAFTKARVSLGAEVGLVAGPVGAGGSVEAALIANSASTAPIWSYMKSRGFYAGVQADGTVIVVRPDANGEFYGRRGIAADQILRGQVPAPGTGANYNPAIPAWPVATRKLMEALKVAEGRTDVDNAVLREVSAGPTPGDLGLADGEHEVEVPYGKEKVQSA
ncbi:hypothetical protein SPBR_02894 [Sporothrix brasiliensis 5110]|uniref:Ysc84 actin-binding domain-containing protein n=1 Tax=Sporothrix brasiliensis 5110 TaxID=1398154 RepID=A0A0C2IZ91_9PEZI|nr:uncharacterized protein SPBR_02894 [Sporothrix brasiliensis 5110]KIH92045.1 hypothetical protein SPBR_02894 [Sporothrix brasiliensis 5110]